MTNAEKCRRYKEKIKADPLAHDAFKEKRREECKRYHTNLSDEQRLIKKEKDRIRQQKYRVGSFSQSSHLHQEPPNIMNVQVLDSVSEVKQESEVDLEKAESQPYVYFDRDDVPSLSWSQHHNFQQGQFKMASTSVSDRDFTEKLVEEVQRHPVLYNPREPGYKDRLVVEAEWQAVGLCLGCTADSAKRRWQNLRGSYSRSRSGQKLPSGSVAPAKKKPQFYLAHQMSFLEPHMQHGSVPGGFGSSEPESLWEESAWGSGSQDGLERAGASTSSPSQSGEEPEPQPLEPTMPATAAPGTQRRKRSAPTLDKEELFKEKAARFSESKGQGQDSPYKEDLESLRGLLPHMAILSGRRKRTYLRKIYNLLFEMVEEDEGETDSSMSAVYI